MNLFEEFSYNPFEKKKFYIDDFISSREYETLYKDFKKAIDLINNKIDLVLFKDKFHYPSNKFIIIEPHIITFNLFIKSLILQKIIEKNKIIEIEVFDEELENNLFFHGELRSYRFLNQYALIAKKIGSPFKIIYKGKSKIKYKNDPSTKNKLLNLLNFNYKVLIYELRKRFFKDNNKKKILKIGQNYLTREIEFELYKSGIGLIDKKMELNDFFNDIRIDHKKYDFYDLVFKIVLSETSKLSKKYFFNNKILNAFIELLAEIINYNTINLISKKEFMRSKLKEYKEELNFNICLSNGLFGVFGKSVYDALHYNGIRVFSAEHGLTVGNSKDSIQYFYANESLTSNYLFCYSNASKSSHLKNKNSNLKIEVTGAPSFPKFSRYKRLKSFLIKKRLKLRGVAVFYISHNIEFNTEKYFPFTKSNSEIFNDELAILSTLGGINKNVIYKPYPTKQFLFDRSSYLQNHLKKYKNIISFKGEEDFRYVRDAADIIITQSSESTLEWCIGLDVPLVFLDSDRYEPLENERVKKVFKKSFFVFNYDKLGWEKDLIKFLNLPYSVISELWKKKAKYRNKYDEYHFLSRRKKAGKIGANYILKSI
ncbi:MAG: hypothetical protein P8M03_06280 [Flavobacteriaceae bacterium]|nr:hypothetical protein [Flavobacteriaceae bacterium]